MHPGPAGWLSEDPTTAWEAGVLPPALVLLVERCQGAKLPCASGCCWLAGQTYSDKHWGQEEAPVVAYWHFGVSLNSPQTLQCSCG